MLQRFGWLGLVAFCAYMLFQPGWAPNVAGFVRLGSLESIDELPTFDDGSLQEFLTNRDQVTVTVAETTTVSEFLSQYSMDYGSVHEAIAEQLGVPQVTPSTRLSAGQELTLQLTPRAVGEP